MQICCRSDHACRPNRDHTCLSLAHTPGRTVQQLVQAGAPLRGAQNRVDINQNAKVLVTCDDHDNHIICNAGPHDG